MRVLSLFDGISCGYQALKELNFNITEYYASEIDNFSIKVAKDNHPDIQHIGDVLQVKGEILPKIDLLIGGSPCQGFSFCGKGLNFDDPRSMLFFEFVRLLKELKPKYFLLENVVMKKEFQDIISDYLGVQPIPINSSLLSAQSRPRLYWTNIPNVTVPEDKNILFSEVIGGVSAAMRGRRVNPETGKNTSDTQFPIKQHIEIRKDDKSNCLTTAAKNSLVVKEYKTRELATESQFRYITPEEAERLQTLPQGYTKSVSNSQRLKILGQGWTVSVIKHIFSFMKE